MAFSAALPQLTPEYCQADIGYQASRCAIAFIVIDLLTVGLRFLARHITKTRLGWDDRLLLPALCAILGVCVVVIDTLSLPLI